MVLYLDFKIHNCVLVDGLTTRTDSTTSSLTDSSVTITNSINTLQAGEDQVRWRFTYKVSRIIMHSTFVMQYVTRQILFFISQFILRNLLTRLSLNQTLRHLNKTLQSETNYPSVVHRTVCLTVFFPVCICISVFKTDWDVHKIRYTSLHECLFFMFLEPFPFSDEETSTEIRGYLISHTHAYRHLCIRCLICLTIYLQIPSMWCTKSEEEEKEKFIPTSKSETEKYKVSRTLSFLRSRMVNTKIKNKVRERQ